MKPEEIKEAVNEKLEQLRRDQLIRMAVFSKTKFSRDASNPEILNKFVKRYQRSVPLTCVDCVLVCGLEKKETPLAVEQEAAAE